LSISRLSWKDGFHPGDMGFLLRLGLQFIPRNQNDAASVDRLIIKKGSIIYGIKDTNTSKPHGILFDEDYTETIPPIGTQGRSCVLVMSDTSGNISCRAGTNSDIRGLGYNNDIRNRIPWYTVDNKALIAKVFRFSNIYIGHVSCDDPYWCEYWPAYE